MRLTGRGTGYNTNRFAEPAHWRFHPIWPRDNHEIVHVYTAPLGRPNGRDVHEASRSYLATGLLPLPLSNYVTTTPFRNIQDQVLSYRVGGSFVRFLIERQGMTAVLDFVRQAGGRDVASECMAVW